MKIPNSRDYLKIHLSLMTLSVLVMIIFTTHYYRSYYFFSLYFLSFLFYSIKIILKKYYQQKEVLIKYLDYLVFSVFIIQAIIIWLFPVIENFYIKLDKSIFHAYYDKGIITSIWPFGIGVFIILHLLNKEINKPIPIILSFIFFIFIFLTIHNIM